MPQETLTDGEIGSNDKKLNTCIHHVDGRLDMIAKFSLNYSTRITPLNHQNVEHCCCEIEITITHLRRD